MRRLHVRAVAVAVLAATATAGELPFRGFGARVAALGDVDGDGKPEFAAATRGTEPVVAVVSSVTAKVLWRARAQDAAAVPDQNGDGRPDVVLALQIEKGFPWLRVCDGATGREIAVLAPATKDARFPEGRASFTEAVSVLGDADGDGRPDLLVIRTTPPEMRPGAALEALWPWCKEAEAFVVGLDGRLIADLDAHADPEFRSQVAAPAGDADVDGKADVLVEIDAVKGRIPMELRSVAKGALLQFRRDMNRVNAAACCGDVDGDGRADFLLASEMGRSEEFAGEIRVMSGKDGHEIRVLRGAHDGDRLGAALAILPDADGDGFPDFVAGAPQTEPKKSLQLAGAVVAYSGRTGKILWTTGGEFASGCLGTSLATIGDVDGDGVADVVAGAPGSGDMKAKGGALVLSGKTGKVLATWTP